MRYRYEWSLGAWKFTLSQKSKTDFMGRFGGGWNWNLGFQLGGSTLIINYLVGTLRISKRKGTL